MARRIITGYEKPVSHSRKATSLPLNVIEERIETSSCTALMQIDLLRAVLKSLERKIKDKRLINMRGELQGTPMELEATCIELGVLQMLKREAEKGV